MNVQGTTRFGSRSLLLVLLAAAAVLALWVAGERSVLAEKSETAPPEDVLAVVGDSRITVEEIEEAHSAEFLRLQRERHQLIERALDGVIDDRLLELEAEATGKAVQELLEEHVDSKVGEPTEAEIDAFYEENQARIQGEKEAVAPRISAYLRQQGEREVQRAYLDGLRDKYRVKRYFQPLRMDVEAEGHPALGPEDAPVTIVEFSDFECPYCSRVVPTLEQVREEYGDEVRLVFRQFPLRQIHPNAQKAAEASLCAWEQERFWPMHDALFEDRTALKVEQLKETAARIGLDTEEFDDCLDSGEYADRVAGDLAAGMAAGVTGTPALFINGRFLNGAQPFEVIAEVIDDELEMKDRLD